MDVANDAPVLPFRGRITGSWRAIPFRIVDMEDGTDLLERMGLMWPEADFLQSIVDSSDRYIESIGMPRRMLNRFLEGDHLSWRSVTDYFRLIQRRNFLNDRLPLCWAMPTSFASNLLSGFRTLRRRSIRTMRKFNLLAADLVLIPIKYDQYWCLLSMHNKGDRWEANIFSPSMHTSPINESYQILAEIGRFYQPNLPVDINNVTITTPFRGTLTTVPQDSAVFVCRMAEVLARGAAINFEAHDLRFFRFKMLLELIKRQILDFVSLTPVNEQEDGARGAAFKVYEDQIHELEDLEEDPDVDDITSEEEGYESMSSSQEGDEE